MNADILRLILFVAGLALILGIYFWDRRKRRGMRGNAVRRAVKRSENRVSDHGDSPIRREPVWDGVPAEFPDGQQESRLPNDSEIVERLETAAQDEHLQNPLFEPLEQAAFHFDQDTSSVELPVKILQINVRAKKGQFSGNSILMAAKEVDLVPGEMQIFHYQVGGGKGTTSLFSMASIVEPGTFPFGDMTVFTTPGVTLFAQLPGPRDGLEVFERMLDTAKRLAVRLDGEVLDETRSDMSKQTIEHIREEIMEHSRRVRLARIKR
ncbi:MAG: cell division protein ZipA [Gammaproteobacteria bacterium]|nr:cell division protein ZipA [Gammaproteobacteria bacterium]